MLPANLAAVAPHPTQTLEAVTRALGDKAKRIEARLDEVTVLVTPANYLEAARILHEHPECQFDQLLDLCGVDYSEYQMGDWDGPRFAVVSHLLSVKLNQRLRLRVFCADDELPEIDSLVSVWSSVNWFEREAFDLFGIIFVGHPDLRRILTDYGFIGHPFRKDFPISGQVEMIYDAERKRVIYQPVTIEPREVTPRIIREDNYGGLNG